MTNDRQQQARGGSHTPSHEWRTSWTFSIRHSSFFIFALALVGTMGLDAAPEGQAAPAQASSPAAPATGQPKPAEPAKPGESPSTGAAQEPQGYTYNPEGRRDPFVSLLRSGDGRSTVGVGSRPPGLAGLSASEVALKGTMQSRTGYVALVQGADNRTYIVRAGDKLLDGTVRAVTETGMVILQQVSDPLSLQKEREVRKVLRQTDEVK